MSKEYLTQCWSCLGEFDAAAAVWCTCSARTPTKLCPFCIHCFCQADPEYQEKFWRDAPAELSEERDILKNAPDTVGESLIRSNLLNTDQLLSALKYQQSRGVALDAAVVDLGFVSRENLALVRQGPAPGGTAIDLSRQLIDASLVSAITVDLCFRKRVLPVSREEIGGSAVLTLAMAGAADLDTIDQIQTLTGCRIIPMSAPESEIVARLRDLFPDDVVRLTSDEAAAPVVAGAPPAAARPGRRAPGRAPVAVAAAVAAAAPPALEEPVPIEEIQEPPSSGPSPGPDPLALPDDLPIPSPVARADPAPATDAAPDPERSLQRILSEAIARHASTVQIEIRGSAVSLFLRIDGTLFRARPPAGQAAEQLSRAVAAGASLPPGDQPAVGRLVARAGERRLEVVVRRRPFAGGESLILRIIDPSGYLRPIDDLGPSTLDGDRILRALSQPAGLLVLSAPPHNGLDATRYSLLAHLARESRRILSIESPRFLTIEGARQQEIPPPPAAGAVRAALASGRGAEVIFLPEIDSTEMAALAIEQAAGCLVVAPVPARRASQAPGALLWHGVEPAALGACLKLVINQRLVRRLCDGCRAPSPVDDRIFKMMGLTSDEFLDLKVSLGSGCARCGPLSPGYSGRVALFEVLEGTPEIAALISSSSSPGEIEREARRAGMSPLRAACLARVGQGITTLEEFQKGNF